MQGAIDGKYYCHQNRTKVLSDRMLRRNVPSQHMQMYFSPRSVQTRYVHMPMLDCHKPSNTNCETLPTYSVNTMYSPSDSLPFNGYQTNVDVESRLRNIIFPIQKAVQSKFINYLTANNKFYPNNPHQLLTREEPLPKFNPNKHNIGKKMFNNSTRVEIRSLE